MCPAPTQVPFSTLVSLVDQLLEDCDEDTDCLALRLGGLEPAIRDELLVSDLLNAWQVFFYFFRIRAGDLLREQLELEPASALRHGVKIQETDLLELYFVVRDAKPVIAISDGDRTVATFSGKAAFEQGLEFLKNPEYQ